MKHNFKTTILIAAIGMIVYAIYVLTHYALSEVCPTPYHYDLWTDICERLIFDIMPVSLILAGVNLWKYRPAPNASKSFRVFTVCLFVVLIVTLLFPLNTHRIIGMAYFFPSIYWRAILLITGIVWLFMLRKQPLEESSPTSYRVMLIIAMLLLALPIIFETISGISLLCGREYVLGLHSSAIKSWVRYIAPTIMLCWYSVALYRASKNNKNN
jgi:hypothetical protein